MIYVPEFNEGNCVVVRSSDTLRVYDQTPTNNSNIHYIDYYYTSNYLYQEGYQSFSSYSILPVCLDIDKITTDYVYRNDFPLILLTFCLFVGIIWFLVSKLIKTLFRGFRRY